MITPASDDRPEQGEEAERDVEDQQPHHPADHSERHRREDQERLGHAIELEDQGQVDPQDRDHHRHGHEGEPLGLLLFLTAEAVAIAGRPGLRCLDQLLFQGRGHGAGEDPRHGVALDDHATLVVASGDLGRDHLGLEGADLLEGDLRAAPRKNLERLHVFHPAPLVGPEPDDHGNLAIALADGRGGVAGEAGVGHQGDVLVGHAGHVGAVGVDLEVHLERGRVPVVVDVLGPEILTHQALDLKPWRWRKTPQRKRTINRSGGIAYS